MTRLQVKKGAYLVGKGWKTAPRPPHLMGANNFVDPTTGREYTLEEAYRVQAERDGVKDD